MITTQPATPRIIDGPVAADRLSNLRIVLVSTQHPGNIGSAARAMLTMGVRDLVLVNPERYPHPQARATAAHALPVLESARVVDSLDEAVADCAWVVGLSVRARHLGDEPMQPWQAAQRAVELAEQARVAFVFGCERTGLLNEEIERCHATVRIPANPGYSSLNLAQAVQVVAYDLRRAALPDVPAVATKKQMPAFEPATAEEFERFYAHLERVLAQTGFLDPRNPGLLMRRLRTLFGRAAPDRNEMNILRGILTSVETPKRRTPRREAGAPSSAVGNDGETAEDG